MSDFYAQSETPSIEKASNLWYNTSENDTLFAGIKRMRAGISIASYYANNQLDSLMNIALEMKRIGEKFNKKRWLFHANQKISKYYFLKNEVDSCLIYLERAKINIEKKYPYLKAWYLSNIARAYSTLLNDIEQAEHYYLACLQVAETHNIDYFKRFAYFGLADIYHKKNDYLKALNYCFKTVKLKGKRLDRQKIALARIALIYEELGLKEYAKDIYSSTNELFYKPNNDDDPIQKVKNYEILLTGPASLKEAKAYFDKGISIIDSISLAEYFRLSFLHKLGHKYQENNNYDEALKYFKECLNRAQKNGNIPYQQTTYLPLAQIYLKKGEFTLSLKNCRQAEQFFGKTKKSDGYNQCSYELYKTFSKNFENLGQLDSALHYLRKSEVLLNFSNHAELTKAVISQYLKFKEEQINEIIKIKKRNAQKTAKMAAINRQKFNYIIGLILLFTIIFSSIFVTHLRQKNNFNKQLENNNQELKLKKDNLKRLNEDLNNKSYVVSHRIHTELISIISLGKEISSKGLKISEKDLLNYYQLSSTKFRILKDYCKDILTQKHD